ncbi:MAG: sugar phosphate nucleotidyltransferase [Pseudomonadota bacterium]
MKSVVLPVAGQGSRLLPLTKVTPKELLPVFDRTVIQFAVDEAIVAGAKRLVVVTHTSKPAIRRYFESVDEQIAKLKAQQKFKLSEALASCGGRGDIEIVFAEQHEALGLGHAILCAEDMVLDGDFGVILPDDVILGAPCLAEMKAAKGAGNIVAAMDVHPSDVSKYGIFDLQDTSRPGHALAAKGMIEKPSADIAPSTLAAVGRYILKPEIFDVLRTIPRGAGGEYQLTDAIAAMTADFGLSAYQFSGQRFDCGSHSGLLQAANARFEQTLQNDAAFATAAE